MYYVRKTREWFFYVRKTREWFFYVRKKMEWFSSRDAPISIIIRKIFYNKIKLTIMKYQLLVLIDKSKLILDLELHLDLEFVNVFRHLID